MAKNLTALESAQSVYDAAAEKLQKAKDALELQHASAREAVAKLRRLEHAVMDGDASIARELGDARLEAETATVSIDTFTKAARKAADEEKAARLDYIIENYKADPADLISEARLQDLEAEAREEIDAVLFRLADRIEAHNQAYSTARREISEAQSGIAPNTDALVSRDMLVIAGNTHRDLGAKSVLKSVVGHPELRWHTAANAEATAKAKAEIEAKRAEANEQMMADHQMMGRLDETTSSRGVKLTRIDER